MKAVFLILIAAYVSFCMTLYVASSAQVIEPVAAAAAAPVAVNESPEAAAPLTTKAGKQRGTSGRKQSVAAPSQDLESSDKEGTRTATPVPVGPQPKSVSL